MKAKGLTLFLALLAASIFVAGAGAQQAIIEVTPASYTVSSVGLTFNVTVIVQNVEDLYGYGFKLYYPSDILNGTSVTQGPFLKSGGVSTFFYVAEFTDNYNATNGFLNVLCTRTGSQTPGMNGSGTLVTVTFKSTSTSGPRTLHLADAELSDANINPIIFTVADGEVTVVPEFPVVMTLPLLAILTLVAVACGKRTRKNKKP